MLVLPIALALGGCGGGTSDGDKVGKVIHEYFAGLAARDGAAVCNLLTSQVQTQFIRAASRRPGPPAADCQGAVVKLERGLPQSVLSPLGHVRVHIGVVQGTAVTAHTLGGPVIRRQGLNIVRIQKFGDNWLVSEAGLTRRRAYASHPAPSTAKGPSASS